MRIGALLGARWPRSWRGPPAVWTRPQEPRSAPRRRCDGEGAISDIAGLQLEGVLVLGLGSPLLSSGWDMILAEGRRRSPLRSAAAAIPQRSSSSERPRVAGPLAGSMPPARRKEEGGKGRRTIWERDI